MPLAINTIKHPSLWESLVRLLGIVLLLLLISTPSSAKQWTLPECINYAIEHNISLKQRENTCRQNELNLNTAKNSRLPDLNAGVSENLGFGRSLGMDNTYSNNNTSNTSKPESSVQQSSEEKSKTEESTSSETDETQYSVDEVSDESKPESSEESIQTTKTAPELPEKFWQDTWSTAESEKDIIRYCRCTDETNPMYGYLYGVTSAGGLSYSYYTGVDDKAKDTNIIVILICTFISFIRFSLPYIFNVFKTIS